MTYLIIIIVIAVVLGPVMWMMPSTKQRQQIAVRQYALKQGLQIKICDFPQTHRQEVRKETVSKGVVYRIPLIMSSPTVMTNIFRLHRFEGQLEWQGEPNIAVKKLFEAAIAASPEDTVAIELSAAGVACYWSEKGGIAAVDTIKATLVSLRAQL